MTIVPVGETSMLAAPAPSTIEEISIRKIV
jgi:hypothetical protein